MRRKKIFLAILPVTIIASCTFYQKNPKLHYYRGPIVPPEFIHIVRASSQEIEFVLRIKFAHKQLYHLVLDGDEPIAEGWYPTIKGDEVSYSVVMKAKPGLRYEPGKTYRLCIGNQSPEYVQLESNNYQCITEYTFIFEEK